MHLIKTIKLNFVFFSDKNFSLYLLVVVLNNKLDKEIKG